MVVGALPAALVPLGAKGYRHEVKKGRTTSR